MTLSVPTGYSASNLVYQDGFNNGATLDSDWHKYITSRAANGWAWNSYGSEGGNGPGSTNNIDYNVADHVTQHNGVLDILTTKESITGLNQGTVQTFPYTSGAVSGYGNFEFTGGLLQISMKAPPSGSGAWPSLWLMPGAGSNQGDSFEIDIQEGGYTGKGDPNRAFTWHLHGPGGQVGGTIDAGVDLSADYHTYAIDWQPGKSITWYLDGKQMAQVTSAQMTIPSQPMQLIMNNQMASDATSGWHTVTGSATPSEMHMLVDGVQLYQKPGTGQSVTGGNIVAGVTPEDPNSFGPTQPVNVAPTVTGVTGPTGVEHVGDKVQLTVAFSEAVIVGGKPTLTLNDGGTATYVGGSGTGKLTFETTIAASDKSVAALGITAVNLPNGATIKDSGGLSANLAGAVKTLPGLSVDTAPVVTEPTQPVNTAPSVTGVTGPTGVEHVGDKIQLTVAFDEAVTVSGKPTLSLNDGGTAAYVSGSGTGKLVFETTIAATDKSVATLGVTALNLPNGATIKDAGGLAANLAGAVKTLPGLSVDTSPIVTEPTQPTAPTQPTTPPVAAGPTKPVLTVPDHQLSVSTGGRIDLGIDVSTTDPNDRISVNIKGLPSYETIVDGLGHTHRGNSITLSQAEVDSGLTLKSNYKGSDSPVATLTVTATAWDPTTRTTASTSSTVSIKDPPLQAGNPTTPTTPTQPTTPTAPSAPGSGGQGGDHGHDHCFAQLIQALAGGLQGRDQGALANAGNQVQSWLNEHILTRPHA